MASNKPNCMKLYFIFRAMDFGMSSWESALLCSLWSATNAPLLSPLACVLYFRMTWKSLLKERSRKSQGFQLPHAPIPAQMCNMHRAATTLNQGANVQPRESKLRTEDDAQAHQSSSFSNHNFKFRATFMSLSVIFRPELRFSGL